MTIERSKYGFSFIRGRFFYKPTKLDKKEEKYLTKYIRQLGCVPVIKDGVFDVTETFKPLVLSELRKEWSLYLTKLGCNPYSSLPSGTTCDNVHLEVIENGFKLSYSSDIRTGNYNTDNKLISEDIYLWV